MSIAVKVSFENQNIGNVFALNFNTEPSLPLTPAHETEIQKWYMQSSTTSIYHYST